MSKKRKILWTRCVACNLEFTVSAEPFLLTTEDGKTLEFNPCPSAPYICAECRLVPKLMKAARKAMLKHFEKDRHNE